MLDEKRILILESDPRAARTAQVRLRTAGFRAKRVASVEELLELCIETRPHGILVEIGDDPEQLRDMLADLRQRQVNPPAIVFSIRDEDSLDWDGNETRIVIKPIDPIQLIEQMNEAIADRETRNEPSDRCLIPPLSKWTEHVRSLDSDIDVIYSTLTKFIENHLVEAPDQKTTREAAKNSKASST
ncbi:MAG: DNA-binding response OmpR family regulator [Pirellulaceae bacterium]|jgi:DNA-binding response OmpR family regulator